MKLIANVARYHRKSPPKKTHENFNALSDEEKFIVKALSAILRIADAVDRTHDARVSCVDVRIENLVVYFQFTSKKELLLEINAFNSKKNLFEDVFNVKAVAR